MFSPLETSNSQKLRFIMVSVRNIALTLCHRKYKSIGKNCDICDTMKLGGAFSVSNTQSLTPIRMSFKEINDTTFKSVNNPIIVMHGLFGSKANWLSVGKVMTSETRRKVYLLDARNHGDSPHSDEHTYLHLAEDLHLFMKENTIEKAALIGHSMGGRAVMAYALNYPEGIESLTVVDISPVGTPKIMDVVGVIFDVMNAIPPTLIENLSFLRRNIEAQLEKLFKSKDLPNFLSMNLAENENGKFSWKINLQSLQKNYNHIKVFPITTGKFDGPTMFVCGARSDFLDFKDVDKIKKLFPKASFVKVENAGHWVHIEQPKMFSEVVCKFINSIKP